MKKNQQFEWVKLGDGRSVYRQARDASPDRRSSLGSPQIQTGQITPYDCPITGRIIEDRQDHVQNLRRHGCRILEAGEKEKAQRDGPRQRAERVDRAVEAAIAEIAPSIDI